MQLNGGTPTATACELSQHSRDVAAAAANGSDEAATTIIAAVQCRGDCPEVAAEVAIAAAEKRPLETAL